MEQSSTSKGQRIAIWAIIIALAIGSVGAYFVIILQNDNAKIDQAKQQELVKKAEAEQKKQQEEQAKMTKDPLDGYEAAPFDKASVTALAVEELKPGEGKAAEKTSTVDANYFGWTSDGKIFDSSKRNGVTNPATFPLNQVIPGWTEGLTGVKEGAVVKLTIPGDKAYGAQGAPGAGIGPNEPLVFIVELKKVK
jgi:FKBP-type peptidyl-prolyl cis-trans isomerase